MAKVINTVIKLRRDNDFNYRKVEETFIPQKGEVCLVDTAYMGLQIKIGDGITNYKNLLYTNQVLVRGYLKDGVFYSTEELNEELAKIFGRIYIDNYNINNLYYWDGEKYEKIGKNLPVASSVEAGILKLYNELGDNTDGTITQAKITSELNQKVSASVDGEIAIFSV